MQIDELINKNALAREFGLKKGAIRKSLIHKRYKHKIEMLNALLEFWRKQNL